MKFFKRTASQGDVYFCRVDALPDGLNESPLKEAFLVITHSESGHHHGIDLMERPDAAKLYKPKTGDGRLSYLQIMGKEPFVLEHHRDVNQHETISLDPGVYEVIRQREYFSPTQQRMVED